MEKLSSHYLSYITYIINLKNTCYVMLIVWLEIYSNTFGVMSTKILNENVSTSLPSKYEPIDASILPMSMSTSTILPITTVNATPSYCKTATAIKGWQCHCWRNTEEVNMIFFSK